MVDLNKFFEFLSIQSISSEPKYKDEVRKASHWVMDYLKSIRFKVDLWETKGHPVVFAERIVDPKQPTLLIYNHYDVQPVDPLSLWKSPPFEPKIENGEVYARGAQDNKGQCFYVLEALKQLQDDLPINIKLIIEGEEECGSPNLAPLIKEKKKALKADYVAIVDCGIPSLERPAVNLGTRGLVTFDIEVEGTSIDLHSGAHGGIAYNPIHALVKLLDGVRNDNGEVTIPGFYNDIVKLPEEILQKIDFTFDEKEYIKTFSAPASGGEKGKSALERLWLRPTFEINGINGGYTGDGFKTVIPARAHAKFSCRLVPNQKPEKMGELVKHYFENQKIPGIKIKVQINHGFGEAARSNANSKGVKAFHQAYSDVFNKPCKYILEGASIPIIPELAQVSEAEPILVGLGLVTDQIHAPNEHFGVERLKLGVRIIKRAIELLKEPT